MQRQDDVLAAPLHGGCFSAPAAKQGRNVFVDGERRETGAVDEKDRRSAHKASIHCLSFCPTGRV